MHAIMSRVYFGDPEINSREKSNLLEVCEMKYSAIIYWPTYYFFKSKYIQRVRAILVKLNDLIIRYNYAE